MNSNFRGRLIRSNSLPSFSAEIRTPKYETRNQISLRDLKQLREKDEATTTPYNSTSSLSSENNRIIRRDEEFREIENLLLNAEEDFGRNVDRDEVLDILEIENEIDSSSYSGSRSVSMVSLSEDIQDEHLESDDVEEMENQNIGRELNFDNSKLQRALADAIVRKAPLEELECLLSQGASASQQVTQGLTPLHYAVWRRHETAVNLLIKAGCDLNARDDIGYTPLHLCAERGFDDMIHILLDHNVKVNINENLESDLYPIDAVDEPLRLALKHDQLETARLLLENEANPNSRYFFGSEINLLSPLQTELLKLLLSWGAKPNNRDRYGFTPIMKACHFQQEAEEALEERDLISGIEILQHFAQTLKGIESVLVLISHGADINIRTDSRNECRSVLHYAILSGSFTIVDLLIKKGAEINFEPSYNKATPLHLAVLKGDLKIINMLIDAGAHINITTPTMGSPLHVACSEDINNRMEVLQVLLQRGADPNMEVRSEAGRPLRPPLGEYLVSSSHHDLNVVKLLLKYGAKVIMQNPQQCPIGILSCMYNVANNIEVMVELLEAAEQFNIPLIKRTPLLVPSLYRDFFIEVASSPQPLKQLCRTFLRQSKKAHEPDSVGDLNLPVLLQLYLLYETH